MSRPALEVADIFRDHGAAWRRANAGHVSLDQMKVMSAIERCRTVALGGHVARCEGCAHTVIAYNSCRNRHCPKCQGAAARDWLRAREAELLPVGYFHLVFTLPSLIADIVPGGGISADGSRWVSCWSRFFLPVRVLSRLFRRLFLQMLSAAHAADRLKFQGDRAGLADQAAFAAFLAPLRKSEWVVYAKEPFAGPKAVLAYLARYTHRVAISNRRLVAANEKGVTFKWKDYRIEGPGRYKIMTLPTREFIRRFLIHVLPNGLHRIRHYGLFANGNRSTNIARARQLLAMPPHVTEPETDAPSEPNQPRMLPTPCPCCGGRMIIIEVFVRCEPKHRPKTTVPAIRIDTS